MNGSVKKKTDHVVPGSLITGLLSLANHAECVADRCFPIRLLILWIVSRAEGVAWGHIPEHIVSPFVVHHRYSRLHAQHFVWLFRTAAYWLKRELRQEERFARKWTKWKLNDVNKATEEERQRSRALTLPQRGEGRCAASGWGAIAGRLHHLFFAPAPRLDSS